MYRLKQIIEHIGEDRQITPELKVENGVIYLDIDKKYKYEYGNWHIWCDIRWVNLQGGVPNYETDELLDENIFEKVEQDNEDVVLQDSQR